jgi:hypothetical protein
VIFGRVCAAEKRWSPLDLQFFRTWHASHRVPRTRARPSEQRVRRRPPWAEEASDDQRVQSSRPGGFGGGSGRLEMGARGVGVVDEEQPSPGK